MWMEFNFQTWLLCIKFRQISNIQITGFFFSSFRQWRKDEQRAVVCMTLLQHADCGWKGDEPKVVCRTIHTHHTQSFHIYSSVVVRPSECLSLCTNSQRKTEIEIFSPRNIYLFLFGWDGKEYFKSRFPLFNSCSPAQRSNGYYAFVCVYWMILSFSCWSGNIAKTPEM